MQGIAFELLQKSKKTCDKIRAGGENTWKISNGVDRQRSDEQRNGTARIRKATEVRSNATQRKSNDKHREGKALTSDARQRKSDDML